MGKKKDDEKYYKRPNGLYEAIRVINGKRVAFRGRSGKEIEQKMLAYKEQAKGRCLKKPQRIGGASLLKPHPQTALKGISPP